MKWGGKMSDNKVDSILLEIGTTTDKADGGIGKVTKALTSMKKITEGIDTEKFKQIVDAMKGFSGMGDELKNAGSGMRSIASSIKSLSGIDTAKLREVADTVKEVSSALGNLGSNNKVSIRIDSEGAARRSVKPLENGQEAAASTEGVITAAEAAQAAMDGAATSASRLAQEESQLGAAGQSAAAGEEALNGSLNQTNTNSANQRIQQLIDQINKYKATISGMEKGNVKFDPQKYEEAVVGLKRMQRQFESYKESVSNSSKNMDDIAKSVNSIGEAAQRCGLGTVSSILKGIASVLPAVQAGSMEASNGFQAMAVGLEAVQSAIPIIGIVLTILTAIVNAVRQVTNAVRDEVQKIISTVKTVVNKIRSGISAIINKFKELKNKVRESLGFSEKQAGSFIKKLRSVIRLGTFMLLRSMFTQLFEVIKVGFNNLVVYSNKIGTEFHKNVNLIYNDIRQLGASLATAFEPILNVVTPILDYLIQKLIAATNALAQFFSALTGKKFYTKAIKQNKDYTDSLNGAAKAAKNLTVGIDELNILNDTKNESGKNDDVDGSGFEESPIDEKYKNLAELIKEAWENADFYDIGRMVGEKLKEALESIPWDKIKITLRKIAKCIATFLNGFLETPGLFSVIGKTVAEAINSAFEFLDEFVWDFHWTSLGKAIVDAVQGFVDNLDWNVISSAITGLARGLADLFNTIFSATDTWGDVGTSISKAINLVLHGVYLFVHDFDFYNFGTAIANGLGNALGGISFWKLGDILSTGINGAFTALLSFSETFPWTRIATSVAEGINRAFDLDWPTIQNSVVTFCTKLGESFSAFLLQVDWVKVLTSIVLGIQTAAKGIGAFFSSVDWQAVADNIVEGINAAIDAFNPEEWATAINAIVDALKTVVDTAVHDVDWEELMSKVGDLMSDVDWGEILSIVFEVFAAEWTFDRMFELVSWTSIWDLLRTSVIEGIAEKFNAGSDDGEINTIGENIVAGLLGGIRSACMPGPLQTALNCFDNITTIVKGIFGVHSPSTVFEEIGGYLVDGLNGGINGKFKDCKDKVLEWANKVNDWFSGTSFGSICKETWETHGNNILTGFRDKIGEYAITKDNVTTWASKVKEWFNSSSSGGVNTKTWNGYADETITGFKTKVGNSYTQSKDNVTTWASKAKEWFNSSSYGGVNKSTWSNYAANIISGFKTKMGSDYSTCKANVDKWTSSVKTWFTNTCSYDKWYDLAKNVIDGFKEGIGKLYSTCKNSIETWGSSIISWFKEKLDINSPSKVFKKLGVYSVEGYNTGLEKEGEKTKGIVTSWADSFTDMDVNLGTRLKINDSALREYSNNYGSDFTNEAIVQRVTREVSTNGAVQATLNSGGGLKEAIKEALDDLGITTAVSEISKNTKTQADKKEQTIVEIGGKTVTDAVTTQRNANGYSFQGA